MMTTTNTRNLAQKLLLLLLEMERKILKTHKLTYLHTYMHRWKFYFSRSENRTLGTTSQTTNFEFWRRKKKSQLNKYVNGAATEHMSKSNTQFARIIFITCLLCLFFLFFLYRMTEWVVCGLRVCDFYFQKKKKYV